MDVQSSTVVVLHIVAFSLVSLSYQHPTVEQTKCRVKPKDNNVSCSMPCYTLQEYAEDRVAEQCLLGTSNVAYIFLNGVHELVDNVSLNFSDSDSVSLVGKEREIAHNISHAEILCHNQSGFLFRNCSNIDIINLTFTQCGHWYGNIESSKELQATLAFIDTTHVTIENITVRNSTGYGLHAQCTMGHVNLSNSIFAFNNGTPRYSGGNAGFLYKNCPNSPSLLKIVSSQFLHGYSNYIHPLATGLYVFVWSGGVNVEIDNITASGNVAENIFKNMSTGGNVALFLRNRTNITTNQIIVKNSLIAHGTAYQGGGMYVSVTETVPIYAEADHNNVASNTMLSIPEVVTIINTHFIANHGMWEGGGLYSITHESPGIFSPIAKITVRDCVFYSNSLLNPAGGGVAIHVTNHFVLNNVNHSVPQFFTRFINCTIKDNILHFKGTGSNKVFIGSGAVLISLNPAGVLFKDCTITNNSCSGMTAVWSSVKLEGDVTISHNVGTNGGGIILCDNSYILLKPYTTLVLKENGAHTAGGGIYAEDACLQTEQPCFFQPDIEILKDPSLNNTIHVHLINNTAHAGSAIYGGSIDYCMVLPQLVPVRLDWTGAEMFNAVFNIDHNTSDLSLISSDPYKVCFCNGILPDCNNRSFEKTLYPGEKFNFFALTVGQRNGSAPQTVLATLLRGGKCESQLGHLQESQESHNNCSKFEYTVYSNLSREFIQLMVQHLIIVAGASHVKFAQVNVTLRPCPVGFVMTTDCSLHMYTTCDCAPALKSHGVTCYIQRRPLIHRPSAATWWIGYLGRHINGSGYKIIWHHVCPYDFCKKGVVNITTGPSLHDFDGDVQCAYHRTGTLCGGCKSGYSLILGTSECRKCTNAYLSLVLVFITAGLLLVLFLVVSNISVSSGSMSGLIFYANMVQVNRPVFFGESIPLTSVKLCSIFIAWLNLDFGIDTCFYNGMDAYTKTWLQFAFPLYVWGIAGIIIRLSRRFPSIAGRNPVRVLATLFLLSYAKLLRTVITALAPAELFIYDINGTNKITKLVWKEDGNVDYLRGKHIPLFVVAFMFGLVTLPYAVALFLVQWLQKYSHRRVGSWVVRMKPLFDAYTGPYKTNTQFWTGSLLLIRVVTFLVFTFPHADPNVKLSVILATCIVVQMIAWSFHGLFQSIYTDVMNSIFLLNLGLLSAVTNYYNTHPGQSDYHSVLILVSVGTAWFIFMFHLLYYTFREGRKRKAWKRFEHYLKETWCSQRGRGPTDGSGDGVSSVAVTQSIVDPFNIQYREPLVSPSSGAPSSYGAISLPEKM